MTGPPRTLLPQSRTRDHAVHAGPSHPLDHWKECTPLLLAPSSHSPNNNWLIVQSHTVTSVAMVVLWTMPSSTLLTTVSLPKLLTHTLERVALANHSRLLFKTRDTPTLLLTAHHKWKLQSKRDQSQLPLKLTRWSSNSTLVVLSTHQHAVLTSTTVSWLLVMELMPNTVTTGNLRTHGVPHGVRKDSSDSLDPRSQAQVSAVSSKNHHTQLSDHIEIIINPQLSQRYISLR